MQRPVLNEDRVHPSIRERLGAPNATLAEVQSAVATHDVVVVGMSQNPHPRRAREALSKKGVPFHYLSYGSYLGEWRRRLVLKMWTGWPTFPMVFVKGTLIGGASELQQLIDTGELDRMLASR
jgi:monothiol glutaredoxin